MGNSIKPHLRNAEKTGVCQLRNNQITEFPKELFQLEKVLRTLDLSNNKIPSLPATIGNFANLKNFAASHNKLAAVPEEVGQLKKLESLNLSTNFLTSVPSTLCNLTNLRTVILSSNHLTQIPSCFTSVRHLELLDLSHNRITEVPDHVSEITVTEINLNQNQIAVLSEAVADCQRLKVLRLEENCLQLSAIPKKILTDSQISLLTLDGNLFELKELHELEGYDAYMERFTATKKKMF